MDTIENVIYNFLVVFLAFLISKISMSLAIAIIIGHVVGLVVGLVISKYKKGVRVFSNTAYINHEWDIYKYEYYFKSHRLNKFKINREIKKAKANMTPVVYTLRDIMGDVGIARDAHTGYDFVVNKAGGKWVADEDMRSVRYEK